MKSLPGGVCPRHDIVVRGAICPLCGFAPPPAPQPSKCGRCGGLYMPRKRQQVCDECKRRKLLHI